VERHDQRIDRHLRWLGLYLAGTADVLGAMAHGFIGSGSAVDETTKGKCAVMAIKGGRE
jgi:hypothetical protein